MRYSNGSLFSKTTLPASGVTSTLSLGLGSWLIMVMVLNRGNALSFVSIAAVVAMMFISSENLLRGSGLLYVGPKSRIIQQCAQGRLPLEVDYRVAVLETLHGVLNGHLTIAEVFVGLGNVGENPRVLRSQSESGLGVGDGFFAKLVLRKEHAEHRLRTRIVGIH